ncbi:hypothetical protein RsTz2092_02820 [Deferribacterales bacterium RsTz2092]|nr:hypothetical protein AGMMS49941_08120 [Deferribacterales bacterium]
MHSFNVNTFFNRFRHLFFVFISLVSIFCIYALLSFVYVGRTDAVPLKWQKHLEISQKELYSNLDNFSIVGVDRNVIRSNSDNATIRVDVGDRGAKDYVRLSLVVARLNTTNYYPKGWWLQYTDRTGKEQARTLTRLQNGFNSSKLIKGGIPAQFNVFSSDVGRGFSMELERAYLSKYPVLPNSFIAPFITLALFAVLIVWCCVYKGLHNWLLARNWALAVIIVLAQLLVFAYNREQCKTFTWEDMPMYMFANISGSDMGLDTNTPFEKLQKPEFGKWYSGYDFERQLSAQSDEGLAHLNQLRSRDSLYSITNFILLHLTSAIFFMGRFSLWIATSLNMLYFVATAFILYLVSRRFLSGKLALLPLLFYGFSNAAISMILMARPTMLPAFFFMLLLYIALALLDKPSLSKRFYVLLAFVFFLGFDSYVYIPVWLAGISIIPLIHLFRQKRFQDIIKCAISLVAGFVMYYLFITGPFLDFLGRTSMNMSTNRFFERLFISSYVINNDLFGGILIYWLLIVAIFACICIYQVKFCGKPVNTSRSTTLKCVAIALGISLTLLTDAKFAPPVHWVHTYHFFPIMPAMVLLLVVISKELFASVVGNAILWKRTLAVIVVIFTISWRYCYVVYDPYSFNGIDVIDVWRATPDYASISSSYKDTPAIAIEHIFQPDVDMHLRQTMIIPADIGSRMKESLNKALNDIKDDRQVIVYVPHDITNTELASLLRKIISEDDVQAVFDTMQQHGYTKRVPFIGGMSWIFSKG